jgi:putative endonuclease
MNSHNYFIYIVTNYNKSTFYIGVTNNLQRRLSEHFENRGSTETFAGRYYCHYLVYFERFQYINDAIAREKQLKKWRREKKINLINEFNPTWKFLNDEIAE